MHPNITLSVPEIAELYKRDRKAHFEQAVKHTKIFVNSESDSKKDVSADSSFGFGDNDKRGEKAEDPIVIDD